MHTHTQAQRRVDVPGAPREQWPLSVTQLPLHRLSSSNPLDPSGRCEFLSRTPFHSESKKWNPEWEPHKSTAWCTLAWRTPRFSTESSNSLDPLGISSCLTTSGMKAVSPQAQHPKSQVLTLLAFLFGSITLLPQNRFLFSSPGKTFLQQSFEPGDQSTIYSFASMRKSAFKSPTFNLQIND